MSTLDPNLEPPGDWQMPYAAPPQGPNPAAERAAIYLWFSAGVQLLMSCCCGFSAFGMMLMGAEEVMRQLPPDMPNRDMLRQVLPVMGPVILVASVVLFLIPAIVLAILAFQVRSGKRSAIITSTVILGVQTLAVGALTLINTLGLLMTGSLSDLGSVVVMAGAVLIFAGTLVQLFKALNQSNKTPPPDAGWNY